jgi:NTE family protein
MLLLFILLSGCAHYPVNPVLQKYDPNSGYRGKGIHLSKNAEDLVLTLTFSGGGTRAAAFSYGVLEELARTEIIINGKKRRLLDEVDAISSVSGGSFTAAYYGLFGEGIFEDFESRFLKKNIQGALGSRAFLNPINWFRLWSPNFDRSDLSAEYYDKHVFDGATFGDIAARKGPMIIINATDMTGGIRLSFIQEVFDIICSDISGFPVARAVAASSAVPVLLTPITLRNYAGSCGFEIPEPLERQLKTQEVPTRLFFLINNILPYLDAESKPYIHLVDGGVADNLGLRAVIDRVLLLGDFWNTLKFAGRENVHKVVVIVVNAETEVDRKWDMEESPPSYAAMVDSYSSIVIGRYNVETIMLLRESFKRWTEQVRSNRCAPGTVSLEPGSCGDIRFYLVEVKFDALKDEAERRYFKGLPTSFNLSPEQVDKLRDAAHRILIQSEEFQQLLTDLQ